MSFDDRGDRGSSLGFGKQGKYSGEPTETLGGVCESTFEEGGDEE